MPLSVRYSRVVEFTKSVQPIFLTRCAMSSQRGDSVVYSLRYSAIMSLTLGRMVNKDVECTFHELYSHGLCFHWRRIAVSPQHPQGGPPALCVGTLIKLERHLEYISWVELPLAHTRMSNFSPSHTPESENSSLKLVRFRLNSFAALIKFLFASTNIDAPSSIGESVVSL